MSGIEAVKNDIVRMALIALESVHEATYQHSVNTANVAALIVSRLGQDGLPHGDVYDAALLHDIGKIRCPVQILDKKGSLTSREQENIFLHPIWGEQILLKLADPRLRGLSRFVREHHELPDASGYPVGVPLSAIHPISRIINIADRFAALTENRTYRKAMPVDYAIGLLRNDIVGFFGKDAEKVVNAIAARPALAGPQTVLKPGGLPLHDVIVQQGMAAAG